jgi:hypothetical protein
MSKENLVKSRCIAILLGVSLLAGLTAYAGTNWQQPYVGEWSNGRGEPLVITGSTIKYGRDKAVNYQDITRVTNGKEFNLQITAAGNLNYLTKFIHISLGEGDKPDEMKMTLYDSRKDMEDGENSQGENTWYRWHGRPAREDTRKMRVPQS